MPPALLGHVSQPAPLQDRSREMDRSTKAMDTTLSTAKEAIATKRRVPHKQSFDYVWRSGVAGGLAGCAVRCLEKVGVHTLTASLQAKSLVAPLDRVKILFQASNPQFAKYTGSWFGVVSAMKVIYKDEGALGLYRGHSATLLRIFPYAAIKFVAYEQIRSLIIRKKEQETPFRRLISGSLAGVTSVFFVYPLDLIRVRLAFETRKDGHSSLFEIVRRIYNEHPQAKSTLPSVSAASSPARAAQIVTQTTISTVQAITPRSGLSNFYRGFSATILGMLPYAGMSFLTHDTAGDLLRSPKISEYTTLPKPENHPAGKAAPLRFWAELFSGGIAGLVSQTASYPVEVIRRRMQVGGTVGDGHRLRILETAGIILKERGFMGFWVGLSIGYVKVVPMVAVSFYAYEKGKTWLGI
jgi:solute carrier family 25 protein 16